MRYPDLACISGPFWLPLEALVLSTELRSSLTWTNGEVHQFVSGTKTELNVQNWWGYEQVTKKQQHVSATLIWNTQEAFTQGYASRSPLPYYEHLTTAPTHQPDIVQPNQWKLMANGTFPYITLCRPYVTLYDPYVTPNSGTLWGVHAEVCNQRFVTQEGWNPSV